MDLYYLLPIVLLIISFASGRTLFEYDSESYSDEDQGNLFSKNEISPGKRNLHQRSIFPSSSTPQTRQQIIDLLRKAYDQGWKPNIKHYLPATRFGRHRR